MNREQDMSLEDAREPNTKPEPMQNIIQVPDDEMFDDPGSDESVREPNTKQPA